MENTPVAAVSVAQTGAESHLAEPDFNICSRIERIPTPFGDDGLEGVGLCGCLQHQFTAEGQAEAADALRIDVGAAAEIVEGGLDVAIAAPAVRVTLALADAAGVEDQHAVPVAREQAYVVSGRQANRVAGARSSASRAAIRPASRAVSS